MTIMQTTKKSLASRLGSNKLVLGFAALIATAIVGTAGIAAAASNNDKPSKAQCAAAGFKNYGQCVKEWAHRKNPPGGGYNGNVNVNLNLKLNNSNNNVIQVIINLFRN